MSDASAPAGTSSTPATDPAPAPAVAAPAAAPTATPANPEPAKQPVTAAESPKTEPAKTEPPKAGDPAQVEPLFKLPDDMKLAPEAVTKFEGAIKGKLADGKITLTAQELVDLYADQARDAATRWQAAQQAQSAEWETESKQRFTAQQLAAAETGVGFLSSFDPQFRELCASFKNHPTFVNAMRIVGERLSEDSFEIGGARPEPTRKQAKDVLYGKRN